MGGKHMGAGKLNGSPGVSLPSLVLCLALMGTPESGAVPLTRRRGQALVAEVDLAAWKAVLGSFAGLGTALREERKTGTESLRYFFASHSERSENWFLTLVSGTEIEGRSRSSVRPMEDKPFHTVTPLLESWALSKVAGMTVFLKCENVQPCGSFKIRGIGHFCQQMAKKGCSHVVCSSGGNAGLAAAYSAQKLGIPATIVLPKNASQQIVRRLQGEGAEVLLTGTVWDEANMRAQELATRDGWVNVSPFDHPLIWEGHASLVRELKASLGTPPGAVVLAVGGGGLLAGVTAGLVEVGWQQVPIVAMETRGAHSFNMAMQAGRLVTLPDITSPRLYRLPPCSSCSVAKSLGAKTVASRALECAQECEILSEVVDDREAVNAVQRFLDDERMLVEPACGAALAAVYSGILGRLQTEGRLHPSLASVVVIVCGGNNINSQHLQELKTQLAHS